MDPQTPEHIWKAFQTTKDHPTFDVEGKNKELERCVPYTADHEDGLSACKHWAKDKPLKWTDTSALKDAEARLHPPKGGPPLFRVVVTYS